MADQYPDLTTDWYADQQGKAWMCIRKKDGMSCTSTNGDFTAATLATFTHWGWERSAPNSPALCEGK